MMNLLEIIRRFLGKILNPCSVDYIGGSDTLPPPLTKEEEMSVFAKLSAGDPHARELLSGGLHCKKV